MTLVSPPNNHISSDDPTLFGEAGFAVMIKHRPDAQRNISVSRDSISDEDDDSTELNDSRSRADPDSLPADRGSHDDMADVPNGVGVNTDPDSSRSIKRRRLTAEEREERQREKDSKIRQRAELVWHHSYYISPRARLAGMVANVSRLIRKRNVTRNVK